MIKKIALWYIAIILLPFGVIYEMGRINVRAWDELENLRKRPAPPPASLRAEEEE